MRWVGVDPGLARVGIAISDPECRYAIPLETVPESVAFPFIRALTQRESVAGIVMGLARLPSGDEGDAAQMARRLGERLRRSLSLPVEYEDETLTSQQAEQLTSSSRPSDDVAASLILQQFLDRKNQANGAGEDVEVTEGRNDPTA